MDETMYEITLDQSQSQSNLSISFEKDTDNATKVNFAMNIGHEHFSELHNNINTLHTSGFVEDYSIVSRCITPDNLNDSTRNGTTQSHQDVIENSSNCNDAENDKVLSTDSTTKGTILKLRKVNNNQPTNVYLLQGTSAKMFPKILALYNTEHGKQIKTLHPASRHTQKYGPISFFRQNLNKCSSAFAELPVLVDHPRVQTINHDSKLW